MHRNHHSSRSSSVVTLPSSGQRLRQRQARRARILMEALEARQLLSATIITDQLDYAFGTTAHISGQGFSPGEAIQLQVRHAEGTPGSNADPQNQPWTVVDGGVGDLDGTVNGNFQATWAVDDPDAGGAAYVLTAVGLTSGETAQTTFTDNVAVTAGNNGTLIPTHYAANGSSPQWTTLGNIKIAEGANGDIAAGQTNVTLILTAPSGWTFNAGVGSVTYTAGTDLTGTPGIVVTSSTITLTLTANAAATKDTINIIGIQVQAVDGGVLPGSGSILRTVANPGTATVTGITNGTTNFGSLSQAVYAKNLTSTVANGTYTTGALIPILVTFGGTVTVTGTPQLVLSSGATVNYSSGSGTNTLTFNYTVAAGNDTTSLEANTLKLNGGTIKDTSATAVQLTLPAVGAAGSLGANTDIVIDAFANAPSKPDLITADDSGKSTTDNITSVATPTFTGTADAGDTVTIYDGGTIVVGTGIAVGGNYSITVSHLADGSHSITAKAQDSLGNVSAASTKLDVTIDTIAPAAPSVPDLKSTSDLGISSTDNLTSDVTPTFTGTSEAGSTVTIYDGDTSVGTDTAASYSVNSTTLSAGAHSISATATDAAGNVSVRSAALIVTIDNVKPTVVITRSATNPTRALTVTFLATYSEGVMNVDAADFAIAASGVSGALITGVVDNGDQTHYTITVNTGTGAGTLGLNSKGTSLTDLAGNALTSGTVTGEIYTIDKVVVSSINRVSATPTNAATLDFTLTFTDSVTGVDISDFTVPVTGTVSGASVLSVAPVSSSVYTVTISSGSGDGTVGLNLNASGTGIQDAFANAVVGGFTGQTYTIDKTTPAIPSTPDMTSGTDSGISTSDNITKDNTPTFAITSETGSTVHLYANGIQVGSAAAGTNITASTLADGVYLMTATASDAAGNVSGVSGALSITIDTVGPAVTVNQAAAQSDPTNASPINFTVVFSEEVTGLLASHFTTSAPGTETKTLSGSGTTYNLAVSNMTSGTVTATLGSGKVTDAAGNDNLASTSTDNSVDYDTIAPTVTVTGPASPTRNSPITFTLVFSEIVTGLTTDGIDLTNCTVDSLSGSGTDYSLVVSPSGQGPVTCQVKASAARDAAGNGNTLSTVRSVIYDTVAPTQPAAPALAAVSDTGTANNDRITNDTTPTFAGVAGSAESLSLLSIYDGATLLGTTIAAADGSWNYTASTMTVEGGHTITVTATDAAGNTSSVSDPLIITLDTAAPSVIAQRDTAANANGWNNTDVFVSYSASDALSGVVPGTQTGSFTFTAEGVGQSHTFTVTDLAGNSASATVSGVNIDKTSPTITAQRDTAANANGWNNTDVFVSYSASDALSGVVPGTQTGNFTFTAEGAGQSHTFTVTDLAGNSGSATVSGVNIDKTSPTVTAQRDTAANANGWNNTDVLASYSASDALSGVVPGTQTGSFTFTAEGAGQSHTFTVTDLAGNSGSATVDNVNIDKTAPTVSVNPMLATYNQPVTITGSANDSAAGLASVTVTVLDSDGVTVLASGPATINGSSWSFQYTPGKISNQSVQAIARDLADNSATAATSFTVNPSAAPVVTTTAGAMNYIENATTAIDATLAVSDTDSTNLVGATTSITSGFVSGQDVLVFSNQNAITGSYNAATGVLTLTGTDTLAHYQTALQSVRYNNTSDAPNTATRTVTFQVNDGSPSNNLGSGTRNITISAVNDAPAVTVPGGQTAADNTNLVIGGVSVADVDGGAGQVTLSAGHGILTMANLTGLSFSSGGNGTSSMVFTGTLGDINIALSNLTYRSAINYDGTDTITVTYSDQGNTGTGGARADTKTIDIAVHDDTPPTAVVTAITGLSADTGPSTSDFITRTASQIISGTYSGTLGVGEHIRVSIDQGIGFIYATASNGTWTASRTLLPGAGTLTATAIDSAGNATAPATHSYILDTVVPTISAQRSPAANSHGWNNTNVVASYSASDALSGLVPGSETGSFTFNSEGTGQSHTFTITDLAGNTTSTTVSGVNIDKTAPSVSVDPLWAYYIQPLTITGSVSDALSGMDRVMVTIFDTDGTTVLASGLATISGTGWSFAYTPDRISNQSVRAVAQDLAGNSATATGNITMVNHVPAIHFAGDATLSEGGTYSGSGSFVDPDTDAWTATVDYGDGSGVQSLAFNPTDHSFTLSHRYDDNGSYSVKVSVNDGTDIGSLSEAVTVTSVAPTGMLGIVGAAVEGSPATFRFTSQTDVSNADLAAGFSYSYSLDGGAFVAGPATYVLSGDNIPDGPSTHTLRGRITDKNGASHEYALTFAVQNAIPIVTIPASAAISTGGTYAVTGSFADSGALDTWTATVNYGDGGATQSLALAGHTFALNHVYTNAGAFTVTVWVSDNDGATGMATHPVTVNQVPPQITGIIVNDGTSAQRSMVTSITCTFSSAVTLDAGAFSLIRSDGQVVVLSYPAGPATSFTLGFSSGPLEGGSLADGRYTLSVTGSKVHLGGTTMAGVATCGITRLFGDSDGDGDVDSADVKAFTLAYTKSKGDPAYQWYFDLDSNNVIDANDYKAFRLRLNKSV